MPEQRDIIHDLLLAGVDILATELKQDDVRGVGPYSLDAVEIIDRDTLLLHVLVQGARLDELQDSLAP